MRLIIRPRGAGLNSCRAPTALPPAAPLPGLSVRGQLFEAPGRLVFTGITHRRRCFSPERRRPVTLPHLLVGVDEVVQGLALAVPVAGLPHDRQRLLVAADGLIELPQLLVGVAEVVQDPRIPVDLASAATRPGPGN